MDFSSRSFVMLRAMMILVAVLAIFSTPTNAVREHPCNDDQDCSASQYCYNVSHICVNFTQCRLHFRKEAAVPARQPSQCGDCLPGYKVQIFSNGEADQQCKLVSTVLQEPKIDSGVNRVWPYVVGGVLISGAIIILIIFVAIKIRKSSSLYKSSLRRHYMEKVGFLPPRATAPPPPQDDAANHLRGPTYPEAAPPRYTSIVGPSIDKNHLVNTTPCNPPSWVTKPHYAPDYNDNVADGVAISVHSSTTNIEMEMDDDDTTPSPWTPEQLAVAVSARPFAAPIFEQQDNVLSHALVVPANLRRGNCSSSSRGGSTSSEDGPEIPEESFGSGMDGGIHCGPNVHITQTITLNIAKNGTK